VQTIIYSDPEGNLLDFTAIPASNSTSVDNEERSYSQLEIGGTVYHIFESAESTKSSTIIWDKDNYRFSIHADLAITELIKTANSVK